MSISDLIFRARMAVDEAKHRVRGGGTKTAQRTLELDELEERVLLSATPMAEAFAPDDVAAQVAVMDIEDVSANRDGENSAGGDADVAEQLERRDAESAELARSFAAPIDNTLTRHEIVFVDRSVDDYQQLVDDIVGQSEDDTSVHVFVLDSDRDGIQQISEVLDRHNGLDAVHVVSHGTDGRVKLGDAWLSNESLGGYAGQFAKWGWSLGSDADILFYGCDLASNSDGQELVAKLSTLTGADVAASVDDTGAAEQGGDWELEYVQGEVETDVAFSAAARSEWAGVLSGAPPTVTTTAGPLAYTEGDGQVVIDNGLTVSDTDDLDLVSATVRIVSGFTPGEDVLSFTDQNGITGMYDSGTGILSLNGTASVADYEAALRSVEYGNTSINPNTAARIVSFQASDGTGNGSANRMINVAAVGNLTADATNDTLDGDTSSLSALLANKGADGAISLREAIIATNNTSGADTIDLAAGTYSLTLTGAAEDTGSTGDLDVLDTLTINGAGAASTIINGNASDRIFHALAGSTLTVSGVTLQNGAADNGGAVLVDSTGTLTLNQSIVTSNTATADGGAISNSGTLTLTDVRLTLNTAPQGGGLNNAGMATLTAVTIDGNTAFNIGGGINNTGAGTTLSVINSTISGNNATGNGGGIYTNQVIDVTNATIFNNTSAAGGGIRTAGGGDVNLKNSILAFNSGGNSNAALNSLGGNIDSANTAGLTEPSDQINTDPNLDPALVDNGGFNPTHALLVGSAAINTGEVTGAPTTDQRGETRIGNPDVGAFEFLGSVVTVDTTTDVVDGNTSSVANLLSDRGTDGFISLREAIIATNNSAGADTIELMSGAYVLAIAGTGENAAATGDLDISDDLNIVGAGPGATAIDGGALDRIFQVSGGVTVTVADMTLTGGNETGAGGAIGGGAIRFNSGNTVTFRDVVFDGNSTLNGNGGAVFASGILTLERVAFVNNSGDVAGAVYVNLGSTVTGTNVTFSGNQSTSNTNGGGALRVLGTLDLTNSTIAFNTALSGAGGIEMAGGGATVSLKNSILSNNTGGNTNTALTSLGYNITDDGVAFSPATGDQLSTDPLLNPLSTVNGTFVHTLQSGSSAIDPAGLTGAPAIDQRKVVRDATPDIGAFEVFDATGSLTPWFSTSGDVVSPSGVTGVDSWGDNEVLQFANPNLSLGSGTSSGTAARLFDINTLADDGDADIYALHYVSTNITVGGANAVNLQVGDILFSTAANEAFGSGGVTINKQDVGLFRPDTPGDYSSGMFSILLDELSPPSIIGQNVLGITLVEQTTLFGDTTLNAGDFVFSHLNPFEADDIMLFETADVGEGTTSGTTSKLINGGDIGLDISAFVNGLELIETEVTIGGETLAAGTLVLQSTLTNSVGTTNLTTTTNDLFALDVTDTTLVAGTAVAEATMFLRGGDVGLDSSAEMVDALTFGPAMAAANTAPTADAGGPYVITEGGALALDGSGSSDPDTDPLTFRWDLDNDGNFGEAGEPTSETANVNWATLQSFGIDDDTGGPFTIGLQVDDGNGGVHVATTTLTVTNTAPTLSTTGSGTTSAGASYTLNLSANDPGADTISSWTINWGDGTIETFAGNPTAVNHTYTAAGFTYNVLASATDEDGTYLQNELVVASSQNDRVLRYGSDGAFLQAFATSDGSDYPVDTVIGPDGNLYLSGWNSDDVLRYDATTGAFIDEFVSAGDGGLDSAAGMAFGPDGNLYVASRLTSEVLRFDGTTGAFIDAFVSAGSGGLDEAEGLTFGPNGDLYVSDYQNSAVYKYDGNTGAFESVFVASGSGGLDKAEDLVFGPDGHLYVADDNGSSVLRYDGTSGAFIDAFVPAGTGGLSFATGLSFGPDGSLYVGSWGTDNVLRFDGTTGAFIDEYITAGSGGLNQTDYFTFLPEHQVTVAANATPTDVTLSNSTVNEGTDTSTGHSVGTLNATDPDTGESFTWDVVGGADQAKFSIGGASSDELILTDGVLDFETGQQSYTVDVEVTDSGAATFVKTLVVTVNDLNDAPVLVVTGTHALDAINESEVTNNGTLVSAIIASAGGDPITDKDATPQEGIAVTSVDDTNGTWEYSTTGGGAWTAFGSVSPGSAVVLGDGPGDRIRFVPNTNYNGTSQIAFRAWDRTDGNSSGAAAVDTTMSGGSSAYSLNSKLASITIVPVEIVFNFSTVGNVTGSGAPGLDSWGSDEWLALGDPNLSFEPGITSGTLLSVRGMGPYADGGITIESMHEVSSDITVGGGGNTIDLLRGDILFSVAEDGITFTGADTIAVLTSKKDVIRFRPSDESFAIVLDEVASPFVNGLTLVEKSTTVGDTTLDAGSFLLNIGNSKDIHYLMPVGAGAGIAAGTPVSLVVGADIDLGSGAVNIAGIDLIEDDISPGNATLVAGQILATLDGDDTDGIGTNLTIDVLANDIFILDLTTTSLGITGVTSGSAELLFEGADLNLDTAAEEVGAMSLTITFGVQPGNADPVLSMPAAPVSYTENASPVLIDSTATVTDADSADFDGGQLSVDFALAGEADDRLAVRHQGTAVGEVGVSGNTISYEGTDIGTFTGGVGTAPLVVTFNSSATETAISALLQNVTYESVSDSPSTTPRVARFVITDGDGGASNVEHKTINVSSVNDAPTVSLANIAAVAENTDTTASVKVADIVITDDGEGSQSVSLTGADLGDFVIVGNELHIAAGTVLDYEAKSSYDIGVTVDDLSVGGSPDDSVLITFNLTDVNDNPPVITASQTFGVSESASNGTAVGTVLATDGDAGTTFSNWMITGGNTGGAFSINAASGAIQVADADAIDFEAQTSFALTVSVSDGVNVSAIESVTINVTDTNDELPVITPGQSFAVSESSSNGTLVGTVLATDADAGTTLSNWQITAGDPSGAFSINTSTGEIDVADANQLDFETQPSFALSLRVWDGVNWSATQTVTVNVTDANDNPPVITPAQTFNVSETAGNGASLGIVLATDPDTSTTFSGWTITGGNAGGAFAMNATNGELTVANAAAIDFESAATFVLSLTVSDGVNTSVAETITINVTDENDTAPVVDTLQTFNVSESAANGTSVGVVTATDADTVGGPLQSWTIVSGNTNGVFAIDANTGELTVADNTNLDFEGTIAYALNISVSDGVNTSLAQTVGVNITNVNDTPPVVEAAQSFNVSESAGVGTSLGFLAASDADGATTFTAWEITSGTSGGAFGIDVNTGELTVANTLDLESTPSYSLGVTVSDGLNTSLVEVVGVTVTNSNEAPTDISLDNTTVAENADGAIVGTLNTTDPDTGDSHTYTVDDARFEVVGNQLKLVAGQTLDFETEPTVNISVTSTDTGALSVMRSFVISVLDANDNVPVVPPSQSFNVSESTTNGTSLGSVLATDSDAGTTFSSWTIVSGNASSAFAIDAATGEVTVQDASALDFETTPTYALGITVSDGVNTSAVEIVTVNVTDTNDSLPIVSPSQSFNVAETASIGTSLGIVLATDADVPTTFSNWQITGGNVGSVFSINANTGELTVTSTLDFETKPSYSLSVTVSDGINTSSSETVSITVADVNDSVPVINTGQVFGVSEQALNGTSVGMVLATDGDAGTTLSNWTIVSGNTSGTFAIDSTTGELTVLDATALDFETTPTYSLGITVSDGVNTSDVQTVAVNVIDQNDGSPFVDAGQTFVLSESATTGTSLGVLAANDDDDGTTFSAWTITGGNSGGAFALNAVTGELTVADATALDFETTPSYSLSVTVSDGTFTSPSEFVTVNITDANEAPTAISLSNAVVSENSAGAIVGTLATTDPDVGDMHAYNVSDARFEVVGNTLKLKDAESLNFESGPTVSLTVTTTDLNGAGLSHSQSFTLIVTDENDVPIANPASFNVAENSAVGTVLGTVTSTDEDTGDSLTWQITSGDPNGAFAINTATGEISVARPLELDFEVTPVFNLQVEVTDSQGASNTSSVTVNVLDQNESPTAITLSNTSVLENKSGAAVGTLATTDEDTSDAHTYSVSDARFEVVSNELRLKPNVTLDHETEPTVNVTMTSVDAGGLTTSEPFVLSVLDDNDAPTSISLTSTTVIENQPGAVIGGVTITDADAGDSHTLTVSDSRFEIIGDATLGHALKLKPGQAVDFETEPTIPLVITATDTSGGTMSQFVSLTVLDRNEAPAVLLSTANSSLNESTDTTSSIRLADIAVTDDALGSHSVTLAGPDAVHFELVTGTSGQELHLRAGTDIDFEVQQTYRVLVQVDDASVGTSPDDTTLHTLHITNINELPTAASDHFVVDEGGVLAVPLSASVLSNDADADGDNLSATLVNGPRHAANFHLNADGTFVYRHDGSETSADSFAYAADDGNGGVDIATVHINVSAVNDAPHAFDATFQIDGGAELAVPPGSLHAIDAERDALSVILVHGPQGGTLQLAPNGAFRYTPHDSFSGVDTFIFRVTDGQDVSNLAAVTIEVIAAPAPIAPVADSPPVVIERVLNEPTVERTPTTVAEPRQDRPTPPTESTTGETKPAVETPADVVQAPVIPVSPTTPPTSDSNASEDTERLAAPPTTNTSDDDFVVGPVNTNGSLLNAPEMTAREIEEASRALSEQLARGRSINFRGIEAVDFESVALPDNVHYVTHSGNSLFNELDEMQDNVASLSDLQTVVVGTAVTATTSLTVGYVLWTIRGGILASSLLAQMPAWRLVDPLVVLDYVQDFDEDGESLESIIEGATTN